MACDLTLNNYRKYDTENDLLNYTPNYMQDCMYTQNTLPANNAEENNINNINNIIDDIKLSDVFDDGGVGTGLTPLNDIDLTDVSGGVGMGTDLTLPNDIDLTNDFDNGGMDIDLVPLDDEAVTGSTEDSSATSGDKHHPSEVDDKG